MTTTGEEGSGGTGGRGGWSWCQGAREEMLGEEGAAAAGLGGVGETHMVAAAIGGGGECEGWRRNEEDMSIFVQNDMYLICPLSRDIYRIMDFTVTYLKNRYFAVACATRGMGLKRDVNPTFRLVLCRWKVCLGFMNFRRKHLNSRVNLEK